MEEKIQLKQHNEVKKIVQELQWNYEVQIKQGEIYIRKIKAVKACKIIFTSLTLVGIILSIFINASMLRIFTSVFAVVPLMLSILDNTFSNYKLNSISYKDALNIECLKEKAISILFDITYNLENQDNIQKEMEKLITSRKELYNSINIPSKRAEKLALKNIKTNIDNEDEEDALIPQELREIRVKA